MCVSLSPRQKQDRFVGSSFTFIQSVPYPRGEAWRRYSISFKVGSGVSGVDGACSFLPFINL